MEETWNAYKTKILKGRERLESRDVNEGYYNRSWTRSVTDSASGIKPTFLSTVTKIQVLWLLNGSWGSLDSIMSDYRLDVRATGVRSPAAAKEFSSRLCVRRCQERVRAILSFPPVACMEVVRQFHFTFNPLKQRRRNYGTRETPDRPICFMWAVLSIRNNKKYYKRERKYRSPSRQSYTYE
jgi:hypothetical protein